jgi:nucleoside 2-deoxyribosyltransferase
MKTLKTYVAGPIGVTIQKNAKVWRNRLTKELEIMNIKVLNPMGKNGGDRLGKDRIKLREACYNGDIKFIRNFVSKVVIPPDLKMVEEADFLTVYIPEDDGYEICGTYGEVTLAFYLKKPVYVVTDRNLSPLKLPAWLIGCSTETFISWKDYLRFIRSII